MNQKITNLNNLKNEGDVSPSMQEILTDLDNNAEKFKVTEDIPVTTPQDTLSKEITEQVITSLAQKYNISVPETYVVITRMVQLGGTSASKPLLKVQLYGKEFDLNDLRTIIKLYDKKGTVRKLAKTIRNIINRIATLNNWPGALYKDLARNYYVEGTIQSQDSYYCSEFNSDNYEPDMPVKIREALLARESRIKSTISTKNIRKGSKKKAKKS